MRRSVRSGWTSRQSAFRRLNPASRCLYSGISNRRVWISKAVMKPTFLLLLTAAVAPAATEAYDIRPVPGTSIELTVEKTGLLSGKKHLFSFREYRGTLMFDRDAPERSSVTLSIESASALCRDSWLSKKDLRKVQEYAVKDMLAADQYPRITFRSADIAKIDPNRYQAQGVLTIRDISKPASLMVSMGVDSSGSPLIEGMSVIR